MKVYIKMNKTIIIFSDIEIEKRPILIKNIGIKNLIVSDKVSLSRKRFYIFYWL